MVKKTIFQVLDNCQQLASSIVIYKNVYLIYTKTYIFDSLDRGDC